MTAANREGLASTVGFATGIVVPLHLIGVASVSIPVFVAVFVGAFSARLLTPALAGKYQRMYFDYASNSNTNLRILNSLAQFTITATISMLSVLINLMVTSLVVTLPVNPFVWPALIAGGISAGIIVALYWYAHREEQSRSQGYINVSWNVGTTPPPPLTTAVPLAQGFRQFQPEPEVPFTITFMNQSQLDVSEIYSYMKNVQISGNTMNFTVPQSKQETTMACLAMQSSNIPTINGLSEDERLAASTANRK